MLDDAEGRLVRKSHGLVWKKTSPSPLLLQSHIEDGETAMHEEKAKRREGAPTGEQWTEGRAVVC